jgi:hypothetical protein
VLTVVWERDVGGGDAIGVAVNATDGCGPAARCSLRRFSILSSPTTAIAIATKKTMNARSRSVRGYTRVPSGPK